MELHEMEERLRRQPDGSGGSAPGIRKPKTARLRIREHSFLDLTREYAVLIMFVALFAVLSIASPPFLTPQNLLNILNAQTPLAIVAAAGTLVIIAGGFDLSTGAIAQVANVCAAWLAVRLNPALGLAVAPFLGLALGTINGLIVTGLRVHSFLATLATSLVFNGLALLITNGMLIPVADKSFTVLGRGEIAGVYIPVFVLVGFAAIATFLLDRTILGRHVFAVGGNAEAAELSGVRVEMVRIATFAFSGLAAGIAGAILVSRIASGQPQMGQDLTLKAIAAVILGGTSIYGGAGAVWRSFAGVFLLALIENGFNLIDANPFFRDLVTGLVIVFAVALAAAGGRKR